MEDVGEEGDVRWDRDAIRIVRRKRMRRVNQERCSYETTTMITKGYRNRTMWGERVQLADDLTSTTRMTERTNG